MTERTDDKDGRSLYARLMAAASSGDHPMSTNILMREAAAALPSLAAPVAWRHKALGNSNWILSGGRPCPPFAMAECGIVEMEPLYLAPSPQAPFEDEIDRIERDDLDASLRELSMAMGNPALEIPDDRSIGGQLVREAIRRLKDPTPVSHTDAQENPLSGGPIMNRPAYGMLDGQEQPSSTAPTKSGLYFHAIPVRVSNNLCGDIDDKPTPLLVVSAEDYDALAQRSATATTGKP